MELPYCDDVPYWKTSRTSPDTWIQKTVRLIKELGCTDVGEAFASLSGRAVYILSFRAGPDRFRVTWPVLNPRNPKDEPAARIQAATLLYHDCKAKAVAAAVFGPRTAFIGSLLLPSDQTVTESSYPDIIAHLDGVKRLCGPG